MRIVPIASTSLQVQFASSAGGAVGTWRGSPRPPLGEPVDVEFTVQAELRWADTLAAVEPGFAIEGNRICIRGRVDAIDELGVATLDVAGATLLVEFADAPPVGAVGAIFELPETPLEICPTGV
ncbi:hypothetical protein [Kribbella sp. NPDC051620]|uniref:hypothetical protein n=1 Tax=Kribbella sp. NPDC051620 TaxID=3364120 RepID=UPI00378D038F